MKQKDVYVCVYSSSVNFNNMKIQFILAIKLLPTVSTIVFRALYI